MGDVIKLKVNNPTVENILQDALARSNEFDCITLIAVKKDGNFVVGYSNQSQTDLAYSAMRFNNFVTDILEE